MSCYESDGCVRIGQVSNCSCHTERISVDNGKYDGNKE